MIRPDDDPATKTVAYVDDASTADEADDVRQRRPERHNENLKTDRRHWAQARGKKKKKAPPRGFFCVCVERGDLGLRCTS